MMKKMVFCFAIGTLFFGVISSCDKVESPYPKSGSGEIDWSLYPDGDSAHYAQNQWPTFTDNSNTLRNAIIEDFTGHQCVPCFATGEAVHDEVYSNPTRIFAAAIHAGPSEDGLTNFQQVNATLGYTEVFYNDEGLALGAFFGDISGGFFGNPRITINRKEFNGDITYSAGQLANITGQVLSSQLKVNIQAASNYFPATSGLFLHTEVDVIDPTLTNDLGLVVYVMEDSIIAPQACPTNLDPDGGAGPNGTDPDGKYHDYVHKDIMRGCIDGKPFGRTLTDDYLINGKYYCNYSYKVPNDLNIDNMHLLIYVYDKTTYEIYQVIKHDL